MFFNTLIVLIAVAVAVAMLSKRIANNLHWRATVTPLASIIGSGFLVIVPLLGHAVGIYAPIAMTIVAIVAYLAGSAIRFNITHAEPLLAAPGASDTTLFRIDAVASAALALAYFVSVTFYLRLMASFAFRGLELHSEIGERVMTTIVLALIGIIGWVRGLHALERLEEYSVSIKLAIIVALLAAWGGHDASVWSTLDRQQLPSPPIDAWHVTRLLCGVVIVVQGFETSRYLGNAYTAAVRVTTMRWAQLSSTVIYVLFVTLTVPTLGALSGRTDETAIIDLSRMVAGVLPLMLVVAALMSQLSAAVADTVGSGGLFAQTIGKRFNLPTKLGYALVASVGIILVWSTNIFEIISIASRLFAAYYALQCVIATETARRSSVGPQRVLRMVAFTILAIALAIAAVIAIPAD